MDPIRLSWSGLRNFEECRQKSFLLRTGKRATLEDQRNFFPGNVTDRTVRDWLHNEPEKNIGGMPEMVEAIVEREELKIKESGGILKWRDAADKGSIIKDCITAVTTIEEDLIEKVLPFDYDADFKFQAPIMLPSPDGDMDEALLIGFMDIIVHDPVTDRWFVYDVKHTKDNGYWRKTRGQLTFYDLAVEVMFGKATEETALLQPLCKEPVKSFEITENERMQMLQRLTSMATGIWNQDVSPRVDNTLCTWCPVKHACSKFTPIVKNGKRRMSLL